MLLVGYCYGLPSERRLCEETHLNLGYRWFCRLGLEGAVPDHSTFSKNRHGRFRESALFRRLFEEVVARCMRAGLVGGEGFAIDASVIEADASSGRKVDGKLTTWPETEKLTRPVREYLAALDQAAAAEAAKSEDADNDIPPGNPPAPPKVTSLTDPTAAWTNKGQRSRVCLWDQLPDRSAASDYRRCRGNTGALDRRSGCDKDNAGADAGVLWPQAAAACRRCRLRLWADDRVADASVGSSRIFRCSTASTRPTASSPAPTSPLTCKPMRLPVPAENRSEAADLVRPDAARCLTGRAPRIAAPAP